jgi:hypothetical protein
MIAMASFTCLTAEPGRASRSATDMATHALQQRDGLLLGCVFPVRHATLLVSRRPYGWPPGT